MRYRTTLWAVVALLVTLPAWAAPSIEMNVAAEREVIDAESGAKQRVPVQSAEPGTELIYTLSYNNSGDEDATDVVIENAIPSGVTFVSETAAEVAAAVFSIDDGATFQPADQLTYEVELPDGSKVKKAARPEQYTHVRWVIEQVAQGSGGDVGFRVRVN